MPFISWMLPRRSLAGSATLATRLTPILQMLGRSIIVSEFRICSSHPSRPGLPGVCLSIKLRLSKAAAAQAGLLAVCSLLECMAQLDASNPAA
jgi:hypothetical protein